ncbi:CatB-related O-acetyltransferase [Geofilum rubicundum]|uniref:CatB-related O-acetyltransferase n=1 Tax=Geofilum rubicundum TaxID=472113 RepID=UPI0007855A59|nr:CatB-related O-acetyltransferase [Geofilum rubicundum]
MRSKLYSFFRRLFDRVYYAARHVRGAVVGGRISGLRHVSFEGENMVPDGCTFSGKVNIGFRTTLGMRNWVHGNVSIGKYCQIGANVMINATNHPVRYMSTYINSSLFNGELYQLKQEKEIRIGNDVWIGHAAIILGGVVVGNGAVIAAGAVVTKDVPAFSIAAGIPAKVVGRRFSETVGDEIEALSWWDKSDEELEQLKPLFFKNLEDANSIYS